VMNDVLVSVARLEEGQRHLETKVGQIMNVMDNKNIEDWSASVDQSQKHLNDKVDTLMNGVVETWANRLLQVLDSELQIHGYIMYMDWTDRQHKSGGGLVCKEDFHFQFQSSLCMSLMNAGFEESLWCTIKIQKSNFLIGLCYRCKFTSSGVTWSNLRASAVIRAAAFNTD